MKLNILVPLDGSALAEGALPTAVDLARRSGGAIRLVRVHVPSAPLAVGTDMGVAVDDPGWDVELREIQAKYLQTVAERVRSEVGGTVDTVLADGPRVAAQVDQAAEAFAADLIVMTTHGHGGRSLAWLGSVADAVVRTTRRQVLILPEAAAGEPMRVSRVLLPLDGSAESATMIEPAVRMAGLYGAEIALLRVVAPPLAGDVLGVLSAEGLDRFGVDRDADDAKRELDQTARELRAHGLTVSCAVVVHANPARALLDYASEVNPGLIAMTTHGRGLSRLLVGSIADKVLRGSGKSTLVQRPAAADQG